MKLNHDPLCVNCELVGITQEAEMVHHSRPVNEYPEHAFDMDTLVSLCNACHNKIEANEGRMSGVKADGSPVDPGHWWNEN